MSSTFRLRRVWPIVLVWSLAGCGLTLAPPGFVRESRHGVCRARLDYNSFRRPSFSFERYDRLPPESARVKLFRWSHGGSVDSPPILPAEHAVIITEPLPVEPFVAHSTPGKPSIDEKTEDSSGGMEGYTPPPPAPPSEIQEPRFPPLKTPPPYVEVKLSREIEAIPSEPAVILEFPEEPRAPRELEVPPANSPVDCTVPILDTGTLWPK